MSASATPFRVYGYRWAVLAVFMFINLTIQVLWISYAPITGPAARFYGVSDLQIGLLSMVFMIAYVPLAIPVAWLIDSYGVRRSVGIGALLMAASGVLRGLAGTNFGLVLWSTVGISVAQPFLLDAWTTVPAHWFAPGERATAVGLVTLSNLAGTALGMLLTPPLTARLPIPTVQLIYGGLTAFSSLLFLVFGREKPPTPPCPPGMENRALMLDGLKHALTVKPFWFYLAVAFVGTGIFAGITTWVETIIRPRGFTPADAGTLGALLIAGGMAGALFLPPLSDRTRRRRRFLLAGFLLAIPGLLGLAFATRLDLLFASAFVLGFFLVGTFPIGMQFAAEITQPTPEGTSNGLIQLFGQASVVFVYVMAAMKTADGSFTPALLFAAGLMIVSLLLITQLRDPAIAARALPLEATPPRLQEEITPDLPGK